jgi:hypothetical protein
MIIGASPETVYQIITLAEAMYGKYALKRIFNSAHIPAVEHTLLPARIPSSLKAAVEPEKRVLPAPLKDTTAWWNLPRKTVCSGRAFSLHLAQQALKIRQNSTITPNIVQLRHGWFSAVVFLYNPY